VDIARTNPWNVPGRYGRVGGTGTAAHIVPATGAVAVLLTQVAAAGPTPAPVIRDFWRYAADAQPGTASPAPSATGAVILR
jgi:hypothetical protein